MRIEPAVLRGRATPRLTEAAGRRRTESASKPMTPRSIPTGFGIAVAAALVSASEE